VKNTIRGINISQHRREVSATPRDIQEDSRSYNELGYIHPDRIPQVPCTIHDISDRQLSGSWLNRHPGIVEPTEQFIQKSRKDRKQLKKKSDLLSHSSSGKIRTKPLSKKQRNYLQSIPKHTIASYLDNRE